MIYSFYRNIIQHNLQLSFSIGESFTSVNNTASSHSRSDVINVTSFCNQRAIQVQMTNLFLFRDLWHPHRFLLNEFPIMNGAFINSFNIDARSSFRLIQTCYLILCVSSTERCNDKIIRKLIQHRQSNKNPIFDLLTSNKSLRIHFTSRQQSKNILNPLLII